VATLIISCVFSSLYVQMITSLFAPRPTRSLERISQ